MDRKPNARFFCSLKLSTSGVESKLSFVSSQSLPLKVIQSELISQYSIHLRGSEILDSDKINRITNLKDLILFSLESKLSKIDENLVSIDIESFELRRGSVILEFTLLLFTAGVSNYDTYSSIADKVLNFIGLDFQNMGFDVKKNFFSLDNEAYHHYTPNHNEIIQTVTTQLQEFEKKFFQDLGDKLTIVRLLVVFLFMGLIGTFTIYSQKSELEDSLKIRKEISEYFNDLNLLKESGIKVPEDSLKAIEKKPKSRVKSAL